MISDKTPLDLFFLAILGGSAATIFLCAGVGWAMSRMVNRGR